MSQTAPPFFSPALSEPADVSLSLARCAETITNELMTLWYEQAGSPAGSVPHLSEAITPLIRMNAPYEGVALQERLRHKMAPDQPVSVRLATVRALWIAGKHPALRGNLFQIVLIALADPKVEVCTFAAGILSLWHLPPPAAARVVPVLIHQLGVFGARSRSLPERFHFPPDPMCLLPSLVDLRQNVPDCFASALLIVTLGRALTHLKHEAGETLLTETLWRNSAWIVGALAGEALYRKGIRDEISALLTVARSASPSETRALARRALTRIGATLPPDDFNEEWFALLTSSDLSVAATAAEAIRISRSGQRQSWSQNKSWIVRQMLSKTSALERGFLSEAVIHSLDYDAYLLYSKSRTEILPDESLTKDLSDYEETLPTSPTRKLDSGLRTFEVSAVALFLECSPNKSEETLSGLLNDLKSTPLAGHIYARTEPEGLTLYAETPEAIFECAALLSQRSRSARLPQGGMMRMGIHAGTLVLENPRVGVWKIRETFSLMAKHLVRQCLLQQILLTEEVSRRTSPESGWRKSLSAPIFVKTESYGRIALLNLYSPSRQTGVPVL